MAVTLIITAVITIIVQRTFLSRSLRGVSYDVYPSKALVEAGESFDIISEISNGKRLPEMYVKLTESLPDGLNLPGGVTGEVKAANGRLEISRSFYMLPRQKLTGRVSVSANNRGRLLLRDAEMLGGDFLGLSSRWKLFPSSAEIIVIPQRADSAALDRLLGGFIGDVSVLRFIMPDPVLTVGLREYTGREPQRDINWKQSARFGRLYVNQYDYTIEPTVTVVLDAEITEYPKPTGEIERCLSIARTIAERLTKNNIRYALMTNALAARSRGAWRGVGDGLGRLHLLETLEGLGCVSYETRFGFGELLKKAVAAAETGRSHIVITPRKITGHERELTALKQSGGLLVITPETAGGGT